jgi:sensor histidine kinase YesM
MQLFSMPNWLFPWVWLLLTQVMLPQSNMSGHFSGLLAGYAMQLMQLLGWLDWYLLAVFYFWIVVLLVGNVKLTTSIDMPWIEVHLFIFESIHPSTYSFTSPQSIFVCSILIFIIFKQNESREINIVAD